MGPLFLLIYINDSTKNISSINKYFANETPIFSIANDISASEYELKIDL